ncbi:DNA replication and repair protein RecF [Guyparkeria halophila]|uniref:DNA replication and repair protein RecF n=1 Tax=Guyparkeria halophila TaxID=47960 RepID=A0A6I6CVU0_9GAMM|nr:DNA replication and repair protein RecF [Guyparkeria halophila]QGT77390.1 DNA replication and repair protein RecF [Guyparkeria halophila]
MTRLATLHVERFRNLEPVDLEPAAGINLIHGVNGAGKTSLLEAIHTLSLGRSFRGNNANELIRHGADDLLLRAEVEARSGRGVHRLAMQRDRRSMVLRVDQENVPRLSELARLLPVLALHPQSDDLVLGSPDHRRRFLDRVGFYARTDFHEIHRNFQRALKQRNALLRRGQREPAWERLYLETAGRLEAARRDVLADLEQRMTDLLDRMLPGHRLTLRYLPGYRQDLALDEAIRQGGERERDQQASLFGPHRADLKIALGDHEARQVASRGQIKMLVVLLHLAVLDLWAEVRGEPAVVLFDDLASELDADNRRRVLDYLGQSGHQAFVSVIAADAIDGEGDIQARFAVEDGQVRKMV